MGKKLGMIGLGKMGLPLARQMMKDGHAVCGYDVDPGRIRMLKEAGGTPVESAKAATEKTGLIHVEMSTMHPTWQKELAGKLAAREPLESLTQ